MELFTSRISWDRSWKILIILLIFMLLFAAMGRGHQNSSSKVSKFTRLLIQIDLINCELILVSIKLSFFPSPSIQLQLSCWLSAEFDWCSKLSWERHFVELFIWKILERLRRNPKKNSMLLILLFPKYSITYIFQKSIFKYLIIL